MNRHFIEDAISFSFYLSLPFVNETKISVNFQEEGRDQQKAAKWGI